MLTLNHVKGYAIGIVAGLATAGILVAAGVLAFGDSDSAEPRVADGAVEPTATVTPTSIPTPRPRVLNPSQVARIGRRLVLLPEDASSASSSIIIDCFVVDDANTDPCRRDTTSLVTVTRGKSSISFDARTGDVFDERIAPGEEGIFDFLKELLGIPP